LSPVLSCATKWSYAGHSEIALSLAAVLSAGRTDDNLAVTILREAHNTFWRRSLWADEAAMKAFMVSGLQRTVMPKPPDWLDQTKNTRPDRE
jgi:hypothetical protein